MNKNSYILRNARIKKWVEARKGRMSMIAQMIDKDRASLYNLIYDNKMSPELIQVIETNQVFAETLEKDCIKQFPFFKRHVMKGDGRVPRLAKKLNVSCEVIRGLARAKGDGRYLMIKYGTDKIIQAIRECENERSNTSYSKEKIDVRAFLTNEVKRKYHTLDEVIHLANMIKENADFGNHDAAVICRVMGEDRYKVISIGFDTVFTDMCKGHICEKKNPHLHAALFASLNIPKHEREKTEQLIVFSHNAPCPTCTKRLITAGISKAYCLYEPELMYGLHDFARHNVPVIKINMYTKTQTQINADQDAA